VDELDQFTVALSEFYGKGHNGKPMLPLISQMSAR
jgi:hypothetical protein